MKMKPVLPLSLLACVSAAAFVTACGGAHRTDTTSQVDIVGGQEVSDAQTDARRWSTVALTTDEKSTRDPNTNPLDAGRSFCSGTIISDTVILTAAHCLQKFNEQTRKKEDGLIFPKEESFIVYFGTKVSRDGTWIRAKRVLPHPEWDPAMTLNPAPTKPANDIGMIVLQSPIPEGYKPVKVAPESFQLKGKVSLAGFGVTRSRNNNDTGTLRQVDVDVRNADARAWRFTVGGFFRGACAGDSGGPAYVNVNGELMVAGATSTGAELLGQCLGLVNNYTDARFYSSWIQTTLSAEGAVAAR